MKTKNLLIFLSITTLAFAKDNSYKNINQKVEGLSENIEAITTTTALGEKSITTTSAWPKIEGKNGVRAQKRWKDVQR